MGHFGGNTARWSHPPIFPTRCKSTTNQWWKKPEKTTNVMNSCSEQYPGFHGQGEGGGGGHPGIPPSRIPKDLYWILVIIIICGLNWNTTQPNQEGGWSTTNQQYFPWAVNPWHLGVDHKCSYWELLNIRYIPRECQRHTSTVEDTLTSYSWVFLLMPKLCLAPTFVSVLGASLPWQRSQVIRSGPPPETRHSCWSFLSLWHDQTPCSPVGCDTLETYMSQTPSLPCKAAPIPILYRYRYRYPQYRYRFISVRVADTHVIHSTWPCASSIMLMHAQLY